MNEKSMRRDLFRVAREKSDVYPFSLFCAPRDGAKPAGPEDKIEVDGREERAMNLKEHVLEELELHEYFVRDALQCLLHTILFVRAPGSLRPRESHCENFGLSFARCGARDVDLAVDGALEEFWRSLRPAGPDLSKGWIAVSFFMRRVKKSFGLFLKEEKVVWEQWVIPVLVNTSPRPTEDDETSVLARGRLQEMAIDLVQGRMLDILNNVNDCIDHVPPVGTEYEFEMMSAPKEDRRESVYARLMQAPSPLNM